MVAIYDIWDLSILVVAWACFWVNWCQTVLHVLKIEKKDTQEEGTVLSLKVDWLESFC